MATTAGALSLVSVSDTKASLSSAAATGGTGPYTYQWYRSTTTAFTPGAGNLIAGATALTLNDTGLIPGTAYFYKVIATDSGAVAGTSAQLAVSTVLSLSPTPNQFAQSNVLGQLDMKFNTDTISAQIDASQATALIAGEAVKMVDSFDGVPKVVGCAANSDGCLGFINYDIKSRSFAAGDKVEISLSGNIMYLYATTAIPRGSRVTLDLSTRGGVGVLVGSSGASIVGWAIDKANVGSLIRVRLTSPSFAVA